MFVFSHTFLVVWKSTFPMFRELYRFQLHTKYLKNTKLWNVCVFPYISCTMENHFSHVSGMVWISASPEIFKKPINLKCLCFPVLFPYYGNPLFPCFGNCMDFSVTQSIWEIYNFGMFVFSHTFPVPWKSTFRTFWELSGFLIQPKYLRNP